MRVYIANFLFVVCLLLPIISIAENQSQIMRYLSEMENLSCDFKQIDINHNERVGHLYISSPNKIRIDYFTPEKESIYILDDLVIHHNHTLQEISYLRTEDVPLKFLSDVTSLNDYTLSKNGTHDLLHIQHTDTHISIAFDGKNIYALTVDDVLLELYNTQYNTQLNADVFIFRQIK